MKTMTVELYSNSGEKVAEFNNIESVTVFDKGYVKITYRDEDKIRIVESNLPFIYYDGVEDSEDYEEELAEKA
jgi:hypothetical protein